MACTCLHCAIGAVVKERFPGKIGPDEASEIATALASFAGSFLAGAPEHAVEAFVAAIYENREMVRQEVGIGAGGLH